MKLRAVSHVPIGRLTAVAALGVAAYLMTQTGSTARFRSIAPGAEFATMRGDPFCRRGPSEIAVLRLDPARVPGGARILDLATQPLDVNAREWGEVAQSFMLFDRSRTIRVRRSGQIANRTVVAEDRQGRLVILTSEGAYTLNDFAQLLIASPLHLVHAMSMDGGSEAELCVVSGGFHYASFGRWDGSADPPEHAGVELPAVISIEAR